MKPTQELLSFVAGRIGEQPDITEEEIRAQLDVYINQRLMPSLGEYDNVYAIVERFPADYQQEHRVTRYSEQEIEQRRALSEGVREGMIEYACWPTRLEKNYLSNGADVTREGRALFYYEAPGETDPRNREILWLVDKNLENRPAYIEEKKQQLMQGGKTEQQAQEEAEAFFTDDAMRKRRSKLVLDRIAEGAEIAQKVGELTSDRHTPQELGANYLAMMNAVDIANDIRTYIGQAANGRDRMEFTAEQLEYLKQRENDQTTLQEAATLLASMGNPCYVFLNPDDVMDSNIDGLINLGGIMAREYRELNRQEDPNFEAFTMGQGDLFQSYATDIRGLRSIRRSHMDKREQRRMREVYGFTPEDTVQVSESNRGYTMYKTTETAIGNGKPVAYEMGNRVMILTSAGTMANPTVSAEDPDALFNHTLTRKSDAVYEMLAATDVKYKISSPEYREMKRALDKARKVRPLGQDENADKRQELEDARKRFETLLANTNAYLAKKPDESAKKYENDRIQAAKEVRDYAETKLRQLELVEKARDTLERYKGMSEDEIRRVTALENAEMAHLKEQDKRREDPVGWLGDLSDRYYKQGLGQVFWHGFSHEVDELRAFERDENGVFANDEDNGLYKCGRLLAGYSVAGELILRERAEREKDGLPGAGPLESIFCGGETEQKEQWGQVLGEQVIEKALGMPMNGLSCEDLSGFLISFDPKVMADQVAEEFSRQCGAEFVNDMENSYRDVAPAVREFVDSSILAKTREYQRQALEGTLNVPHDDITRTLSCQVLADLAQREDQLGEKLCQLMQNRKNVDALLDDIQVSDYVEYLTMPIDQGENTTKIDDIRRLFANRKVIADGFAKRKDFVQTVGTLSIKQAPKDFKDEVVSQYGKPSFTTGPLGEFVISRIINPALAYKAQMETMETTTQFESGYRLMSSCVLAQLVQLEQDPAGVLHQMVGSEKGIDAALGLVQASKPFQEMVADFCKMGDHPDINEIPKLIQGRQPQRAALGILKDAGLRQMLDGMAAEHKSVAENNGPQKGNAQPQSGGRH